MVIERIDQELCNGCEICLKNCTMDVIRMDDKIQKAFIKYPADCICCAYCELDCPEGAIYVSPERSSPTLVAW
jgi:NAD-dependent dihydropyrimidine dehydrogenase PreA subunit